jgi:predicted nucleic acid-binding protein
LGLLIDTSAVIAVERDPRARPELLGSVRDEPVGLPSIVLAELLAGVRLANTTARAVERQAKIDALVSRVPVVDFGEGAAAEWAGLFAELHRRGVPIPSNDLVVAAAARSLDFGVLVGPSGEGHFGHVPGLRVEVLG